MSPPDKPKRTRAEEVAISIFASCVGGAGGFVVGAALGAREFGLVAGAIVGELVVLALFKRDKE